MDYVHLLLSVVYALTSSCLIFAFCLAGAFVTFCDSRSSLLWPCRELPGSTTGVDVWSGKKEGWVTFCGVAF